MGTVIKVLTRLFHKLCLSIIIWQGLMPEDLYLLYHLLWKRGWCIASSLPCTCHTIKGLILYQIKFVLSTVALKDRENACYMTVTNKLIRVTLVVVVRLVIITLESGFEVPSYFFSLYKTWAKHKTGNKVALNPFFSLAVLRPCRNDCWNLSK